MKYNGVEFDAIVATPCCGKSYLCDKYPDKFVDVDEVRLRCKYYVPENLSRAEIESTKGQRTFEKQPRGLVERLYKKLDEYVAAGKTLISAPQPEAVEYLVKNTLALMVVIWRLCV